MKLGIYDIALREKEGWELLAPLSYWNASEEDLEEYMGGCGPGKLGDYFVPDTMYGESVFLACQIHDWMYCIGKDAQDKRYADLVFLWNMTVLVNDGEFLDTFRLRRVMTYYQAVSAAGEEAFMSQRKSNDG